MNQIFVVAICMLLTSCSAAILSIGQDETAILYQGANMETVSQHPGPPVEKTSFSIPKPFSDIANDQDDHILFPLVDRGWDEPTGHAVYPSIFASYLHTYEYTGRIERRKEIGGPIAYALMSWGVSEIWEIPKAIQVQSQKSQYLHTASVWYDENKDAIAYLWLMVTPTENEQ
jgi:hypothetical protein